jgi:hypothetical protein
MKKTIDTNKLLSQAGLPSFTGSPPTTSGGTSSTYPNNLYRYIAPPNIKGAWQVTKNGKLLSRAEDMTKHHNYSIAEVDPSQVSGFWSKRVDYAGREGYVYDMVLKRVEDASLGGNGTLTNTPWVPSPVDGVITFIDFYGNNLDTALEIKSTSGGHYTLLHMDIPYVKKNGNPSGKKWKKGDKVKRGDLLARQSDFMKGKSNGGKFTKNIHLHIEFKDLNVLKNYIKDLVLNNF